MSIKKALCMVICLVSLFHLSYTCGAEEYGYDFIEDFSEGLAAARQNRLWGFVNGEGEVAVPFIYREVSAFSEGLAVVRKDRYYGYIDTSGTEVIPPVYVSARPFSEGLAVVETDGKKGVINREGETVIPLEYDHISDFSEGFAVVEKGGQFNFARQDGSFLFTSFGLQYALPFSSGIAYVRNQLGAQYYINASGSLVFRADMDAVGQFSDGYAVAVRGDKFFIMSANGANVIHATYDYVEEGEEGYFRLMSNDLWGFFDKSKRKVTISPYFEMLFPPSEGLILAVKERRYGFVDENLKTVLPCKYSYAESFSNGLALVRRNDLYGFIDREGKTAIPFKYDEARSFSEGLSIVRLGRYYGCIDKSGRLVIPAEYGYIGEFRDGMAVAKKGGRYVVLKNPLVCPGTASDTAMSE